MRIMKPFCKLSDFCFSWVSLVLVTGTVMGGEPAVIVTVTNNTKDPCCVEFNELTNTISIVKIDHDNAWLDDSKQTAVVTQCLQPSESKNLLLNEKLDEAVLRNVQLEETSARGQGPIGVDSELATKRSGVPAEAQGAQAPDPWASWEEYYMNLAPGSWY